MLMVHGIYHFGPKRIAFRNDYCLSCAQPRRSLQISMFDVGHIFWIPLLPLGFHKRWYCSVCNKRPHVHPGTRRGFKWAGLVVLFVLALAGWAVHPSADDRYLVWALRVAAPAGAILTLIHLLRTPRDLSLQKQLGEVPPARDTLCPFCGTALLILSNSPSYCPTCGVQRLGV